MLKRILGLVGWLGVVLVFAAVFASWGPWPKLTPYANKLAITGLVCTLLYIFSQWREVVEAFSVRQARFGALAAATALVVLGILAGINYLGTRHNKRWDLTAAQQFSLSDQSKKILQDLKEPVKIRIFARSTDFQRFRDRLDEYAYQSKQVSTEYIDLEQKPLVAQQYAVTQPGTVMFEYKGRTEKATGDGEQELTNALIKVVQGRTPKIYFTQGHGERDINGSDRAGYSALSSALKSGNFAIDKIVLAQATDVPADADIMVVAGPKNDLLGPEIELLKKFLGRGGKLLVMLDPVLKPGQPQPAALEALLKDWGIQAGDDIVFDVSRAGQLFGGNTGSVPVAANYPPHPITENFNLITAYPLARLMSAIDGGVNGHTAQKLVETSASSWAETNIKALAAGEPPSPEGDKRGPLSLAAAVSAPAQSAPLPKEMPKDGEASKPVETRVVAFGDSDFAGNEALGVQGNRDLILNTMNWLSQQENLISIRARDPQDRRITLTEGQMNLVRLLTIFVVPGLVLLAGVQTWWRRR